jgi:hypothetical protein
MAGIGFIRQFEAIFGLRPTSFGSERGWTPEFARLTAKGVTFTRRPTDTGSVTLAVFADTCGNLIQLYQTA